MLLMLIFLFSVYFLLFGFSCGHVGALGGGLRVLCGLYRDFAYLRVMDDLVVCYCRYKVSCCVFCLLRLLGV